MPADRIIFRFFVLISRKQRHTMIEKLEFESSDHVIQFPEMESEFEVQAFLYSKLIDLGYAVRGEVQVLGNFGLRKTKASCRFDLIVFEKQQPILILEIKARKVKHKTCVEDTRQSQKYRTFGIPVWFVYGMEGAKQVLIDIKAVV